MTETNTLRAILLAAAKRLPHVRLFRNNVGMGWAGRLIHRTEAGTVALHGARPLHAGLCEGSSDLIGWTTLEITPDMVGRKVAVFTAVEVKVPGKKPTAEQINFITQVRTAGGIAEVLTDAEQVGVLHF
jgi:hypothetical protein